MPRFAPQVVVLFAVALAGVVAAPASGATFSNGTPLAMPEPAATATPYPSKIAVSGLSGGITDVNVTVSGFSHDYVEDVGLLLVGPGGQKIVLVRQFPDEDEAHAVNLTFDDEAVNPLDLTVSGTYRPYDGGCCTFPFPAPPGPYASSLAALDGTAPNGQWQLYMNDTYDEEDGGQISGGWSLSIETRPPDPRLASGSSSPNKGTFTLEWDMFAETTGFDLFRVPAADPDGDEHHVATVEGTSYDLSDEPEGTWVYYVGDYEDPAADRVGPSDPIVVDRTAPNTPTVAIDASQPAPVSVNGVDWYKDEVKFRVTDNGDPDLADGSDGSGVDPRFAPRVYPRTWNGQKTYGFLVKDLARNESARGQITARSDSVAPNLTLTCPQVVVQGSSPEAKWSAGDKNGSGVAGATKGTVGMATDTTGATEVSKTVTDKVGHETTKTCGYVVTPQLRFSLPGGTAVLEGELSNTFNVGGPPVVNTCTWTLRGEIARNDPTRSLMQRLGTPEASDCNVVSDMDPSGTWMMHVGQNGQGELPDEVFVKVRGIEAAATLHGETCDYRGTVDGVWRNGSPSTLELHGRLPLYPKGQPGSRTTSGCVATSTTVDGTLQNTSGDQQIVAATAG